MNYSLCCLLDNNKNIKYKTYTRKSLQSLEIVDARTKVINVINHNIKTLQSFIDYCYENSIKSYRITSDLIPHLEYITQSNILQEKDFNAIKQNIKNINKRDIVLSLHPGQFVNMGSPDESVVEKSIREIEYHILIADLLDFKEINIHLGGSYGDKAQAIKRFLTNIDKFKEYITIENDELSYSIDDCIDVSRESGIPVTFDLHHHRCHSLRDDYEPQKSEYDYFLECKQTWINSGRDYMRIHISSPREGYSTCAKSRPHSDFINPCDVPEWLLEESEKFKIYIDVEAKKKEKAIFELINNFNKQNDKIKKKDGNDII
jgi:UV DNA damage endonuclease